MGLKQTLENAAKVFFTECFLYSGWLEPLMVWAELLPRLSEGDAYWALQGLILSFIRAYFELL